MRRSCFGMILLALLVGCSSMSVQTDFSPEFNFSTLKTFQYRQSERTLASSDPFADQRIVAAIKREMTASGLTGVDSDPDVFVTYYSATEERLQFQTMYTSVGGWGRRGRGSVGMVGSTTRATSYEEGTLVIDVWQAAENQLVWRGEISRTLSSNPDRNAENINRGISRLFEDFPPS